MFKIILYDNIINDAAYNLRKNKRFVHAVLVAMLYGYLTMTINLKDL